jgi:hypothetical protein
MFKKFLICAVSVLSLIALSACGGKESNENETSEIYEFPSVINLKKGAETKIINSSTVFHFVELTDIDDNGVALLSFISDKTSTKEWMSVDSEEEVTLNSTSVSYQWLKISTDADGKKLTLVSQPNKTGKKRTLYLSVYTNDKYVDIQVIQDK